MQKSCPEGPSAGPGARPRVITKFAEYVGSFPVKETDSRRRFWIIEEQMRFLKDCPRRRAVTLKFCLQGVKMYDAEGGETLLMAHALRRIQYTTCRPEDRQFAFVSRNPHRPADQLFCHLFVGGSPGEAQVLNLLLCRSFQLQHLASHPEVEDRAATRVQRKGSGGGVIREPLNPEEVTQNVNALVSFRRLPGEDTMDGGKSPMSEGPNIPRSSSTDTPYCSPTLVRKKAIRSKVIRCGAYRCANSEPQLRGVVRPQTTGRTRHAPGELSEKPDVLVEAVWFGVGIDRDSSLGLLKEDRMGAFVLRPDPGYPGHLTLYMSTQCGVIPYKIYTNQKAKYCFEHLPQEFPSLAALVEHHAGVDSNLFFQLAYGRVNPSYESEDPQSSPPSPRETTAGTKQRAVQEEEQTAVQEEEQRAVREEEQRAVRRKVQGAVQEEEQTAVQEEEQTAVQEEEQRAVQEEEQRAVQEEEQRAVQGEEQRAVQEEEQTAVREEEQRAVQEGECSQRRDEELPIDVDATPSIYLTI